MTSPQEGSSGLHIGLKLAFFLIIGLIILLKYSGTPDQYSVSYFAENNPDLFAGSLYYDNSFFSKSSIFFYANEILRAEVNDVLGLFTNALYAVLAFLVTYLICRDFLDARNTAIIIPALGAMAFISRKVPVDTWNGLISIQPATQTALAIPMAFACLYLIMKARHLQAGALIALTILIHPLADIILVPVMAMYVLLRHRAEARAWAGVAIPVLVVAAKAVFLKISLSTGLPAPDPLAVQEGILEIGGQDALFLAQAPLSLVLLAGAILFSFYFSLRVLTGEIAALMLSLTIAATCTVLGTILYVHVITDWIVIPEILLLGPVRSLYLFNTVLYLCVFVWTLKSSLAPIEKVAVILAVILYHGESLNGLLYPALVLVAGFGVRLIPKLSDWAAKTFSTAVLLVMALPLIVLLQHMNGGVFFTQYNQAGWDHLARWTITLPDDDRAFEAFARLQGTTERAETLHLARTSRGDIQQDHLWSLVSHQAPFLSDKHHFYFRPDLRPEHDAREAIVQQITTALNADQPLPAAGLDFLAERGAQMVAPLSDKQVTAARGQLADLIAKDGVDIRALGDGYTHFVFKRP
ncbi:MAG: hypothetical protein ACPGOV_11250 [Magnetovibrionaceae bacterium]